VGETRVRVRTLFLAVKILSLTRERTRRSILGVYSVEGETSDIIVSAIANSVKRFNIEDKITYFCRNNSNKNFGGAQRRGKSNVLTKLRNPWSRNVLGIGCGAHMIHNCVLKFEIFYQSK
jgi:hypothetical protein